MDKLLLFTDTETTGTSLAKSEVIQVASVAYFNGEWAGTINLSAQPFTYDNINPHALDVCGLTVEKIKTFEQPAVIFKKYINALIKIRDSISPNLQFIPIAHNAPFDKRFLDKWWRNCSNACNERMPRMNNLINETWIDSLPLSRELINNGIIKAENSKLETLADYFNISFTGKGAHDALSDTVVLKNVFFEMAKLANNAEKDGIKLHSKTILESLGV